MWVCRCCGKSFETAHDRMQHERDKHGYPKIEKNVPCSYCDRKFARIHSAKRHEKKSLRCMKKRQNSPPLKVEKNATQLLSSMLSNYYRNQVVIDTLDRKLSKQKCYDIVRKLFRAIGNMDGGDLYSPFNMRISGSTATGTKVNRADEFDLDIPLRIRDVTVSSMNTYGYVNVKSSDPKIADLKSPPGFLLPRNLQTNLHGCVKLAVEKLGLQNEVTVQRKPNGPSTTITLRGPANFRHNMDVDLAPSLDAPENFRLSGIAKDRLNRLLSHKPQATRERVFDTRLILVPKKEEQWLVSYSKVIRNVINSLDGAGECRKMCHKILKYDMIQLLKEKNYPGISTQVFKHQLLWMCQDKMYNKSYWKSENVGSCYIDMLDDLSRRLRSGSLMNYFNDHDDTLEGKDRSVLIGLADALQKRKVELLRDARD